MGSASVVVFLVLAGSGGCRFESGGGTDDTTGGTQDSSGGSDPTGNPTGNPTGDPTTASMTTDPTSSDVTTGDPTSSGPTGDVTTDTDETRGDSESDDTRGDSESDDTRGDSTTGEIDFGPYVPCGEACEGTDLCIDAPTRDPIADVCAPICNVVDTCPASPGGDAELVCVFGVCALDCSEGDCPQGMTCMETGAGEHCYWPM